MSDARIPYTIIKNPGLLTVSLQILKPGLQPEQR